MDGDDKGVLEKFTDTVKSVVETASTAAKAALKPDPEKVAETANEQVYVPEATDAAAVPPSVFTTRKRSGPSKATTAKRVNKRFAKKAAAKKSGPKTPADKSKKTAKKTKSAATKKAASAKKTAPKKSAKNTVAKKAAPKKSKKGRKSKRGRP